ncbi:hypothetical protein [Streptomyces sp. NBC_00696]|uniref:hypothetical protein n=1 Tax=Streptomyces sp. NBC_00696 TaxID=2903672 RepID=UPI002E3764C2|nr:hypothetical protein [Streptomyces sp. NBC_00696]
MSVTPIRSYEIQSSERDQQQPRPAPFFELRFAEWRITLQRPPYRLAGALMTFAGTVSVWFTR